MKDKLPFWLTVGRFWTRRGLLEGRILFHQRVYHCLEVVQHLVRRVQLIRLRRALFDCERKLIAKYGPDWRRRMDSQQCIQASEVFKRCHGAMNRGSSSNRRRTTTR